MLEFCFRFRLSHLRYHRHVIPQVLAELCPNWTIRDRVMTSYPVLIWRPRHRNSTSGSGFVSSFIWEGLNLSTHQFSAKYHNSRLSYYYFRFLKQTSAMLDFYFWFRYSRLRRLSLVILHLSTKFRGNRTIRDILMTSYPLFKMAAVVILLSVSLFVTSLIWEVGSLPANQISAIYLNPRLRYYYSRFWKQTTAILEFYFRFWFSRLRHQRHIILHLPTKFRKSDYVRHSYGIISIYQDGGRQPY